MEGPRHLHLHQEWQGPLEEHINESSNGSWLSPKIISDFLEIWKIGYRIPHDLRYETRKSESSFFSAGRLGPNFCSVLRGLSVDPRESNRLNGRSN